MDEKRYRISRYGYKSWQIEEWQLKNKETEEWRWVAIKYPGRLRHAAEGAVDLCMGDFTAENVQSIMDALKNLTAALETAIAANGAIEIRVGGNR